MELNRRAEKAGSWYPDDPNELATMIEEFLARAKALAEAAPPNESGQVVAGVVPHAGLPFSGCIAARTFHALRASHPALRTILLFGAVHTTSLPKAAIWPSGNWQSPLGPVAVDETATSALCTTGLVQSNPQPHLGDNAIELQIPFIRHCFPDCSIIPVAVPPNLEAVRLGRETFRLFHKRVEAGEMIALASTDLTHYGECYGFAPGGRGETGHLWSKENDQRLLQTILAMQADEIVPQATRERNACGAGALAAAVAFAAAAGCTAGELLEHATSHEIMPRSGADMSVGYASVVFRV